MSKNVRWAGISAAISSISMLGSMACRAQTAAPAADAGTSLEEIVITAERRSENSQKVPIAVTALSGADLDGKAVTSVADLQYATPSLSISDSGLTNSVNIRGIGLASGNPNVGSGNYGEVEADGAINLPVNDILAFRAAGEYISRDSFYTSENAASFVCQ
jgi:outer membrane receptor protein involved in Fe transport